MARDKYSDDHTITVVGETQTLTVEDNLDVVGDLEVGGSLVANTVATSSGNLNLSGDLDVGNNLQVAGNVTAGSNGSFGGVLTADDLVFNDSTTRILKWISGSVLEASVITAIGTDTQVGSDGFDSDTGYPTVTVGHSTNSTWEIYFPLDPFVPDGATIRTIYFVMENASSYTKIGGFDFQCDIESASLLGTGTFSLQESATTSGPATDGVRTLMAFSYTGVTVGTGDNAFTSRFYRAKLEQVDVNPCIITIGKMGIVYEVDSLSQAIGVD